MINALASSARIQQRAALRGAAMGIVTALVAASRPNFSESGLVTFLLNPHAKMPNMSLTRIEAADIAAYIRTLR